MKIRHGFVTNSSSSSYILKSKTGEKLTLEAFKSKLSDYLDTLKFKFKEVEEYVIKCEKSSIPTTISVKYKKKNSNPSLRYITINKDSGIESFGSSLSSPTANNDEYYLNLIREYKLSDIPYYMLELDYFLSNENTFDYEIREISREYMESLPKDNLEDYLDLVRDEILLNSECPYIHQYNYFPYSAGHFDLAQKELSHIKNCDLTDSPCYSKHCRYIKLKEELESIDIESLSYEEYLNLSKKFLEMDTDIDQASNVADIYIYYDESCHNIRHIVPFLESIAITSYMFG